jgi:biopolymer transport protein ExbD
MTSTKFLAIILVLVALVGCRQQPVEQANMNTLKIKVAAGGEITVDGQVASLDQTSAKLVDLKKASGMVLYHRENSQAEPHPNAMKVMKLVADKQLSIRLCAKADFSDSVDEKGVSRPGK